MNKKSVSEKTKTSITYFPIFIKLIQYPPALLVLAQIIFWCFIRSKKNKNLWFYMSIDQWCSELKIKRSVFMRALKILIALGFVSVKRTSKKFPAWYKINEVAVAKYLTKRGYKLSAPTIQNIFNALSADKNNLLLTAENLNITNSGCCSLYYASFELIAKKLLSENPSAIPHMFTQSAKKITALTGLTINQQIRYREKSVTLSTIKTQRFAGDKNLYYQVISASSSISQLENIAFSAIENSTQFESLDVKNSTQFESLDVKNSTQNESLDVKNSTQFEPLTYIEERTYNNKTNLRPLRGAGFSNNPINMIGSVIPNEQYASEFNITGSPAIKFDDHENNLTESEYLTGSPTGRPSPEFEFNNLVNSSKHVEQENNFTESDYLTGRPSPEFDFELDYTGSKRITERPTPPPFDDQLVDFDITGKIIHPTVEQPVVIGSVSPPAQEQPVVIGSVSPPAQEQPVVIGSVSPPAQEQPVVIGSVSESPTDSPSAQFDPLLDSPIFPFFWLKFAAPVVSLAPLISPLISPLFALLAQSSGSNNQDNNNNSGSPPH